MPADPDDGVNSMDLVIAEYKKHVDRTLLRENLKRSVEERLRALKDFNRTAEELRRAMRARRDEHR